MSEKSFDLPGLNGFYFVSRFGSYANSTKRLNVWKCDPLIVV